MCLLCVPIYYYNYTVRSVIYICIYDTFVYYRLGVYMYIYITSRTVENTNYAHCVRIMEKNKLERYNI